MRDQGRYERPRDQRGAPQRDPTTSSRGSGWSRSTTGESEFSEAGVLPIADDNMVEDGNADQRPRCRQLLGDLLVVVAGGRVSRRVVMHQNDRGRAVPDGLLEHLARVDLRRAQPANRHGRHSDYLMPRVEGQDAEVLPVQVTHLPAQQFIYVRGVVDNRTLRRRRRLSATAELERRHQGTRASRPNPATHSSSSSKPEKSAGAGSSVARNHYCGPEVRISTRIIPHAHIAPR